MLINCWILEHVCSFFKLKPFVDLSAFALKSERVRFLQDLIVWPKCFETEMTKTEKSRDRNGSDRNGQIEKSCSVKREQQARRCLFITESQEFYGFSRSTWNKFIATIRAPIKFRMVFYNFCCCNLSTGVALNARFTTNGMCAKNNTRYLQNRRQKVFNRGAFQFCSRALGLCGGAWHYKINQNSIDL